MWEYMGWWLLPPARAGHKQETMAIIICEHHLWVEGGGGWQLKSAHYKRTCKVVCLEPEGQRKGAARSCRSQLRQARWDAASHRVIAPPLQPCTPSRSAAVSLPQLPCTPASSREKPTVGNWC